MKLERLRRFEFARPGGVLAAYDSGGDGVPVVFQHGLCGDVRQVAEAVPDLPGLRLVCLECGGHGASRAARPFSIAAFADDVAALADVLDLRSVLLGGISMGAAIANRLAVTRPDLVRALLLVRPAWVSESAPENMAPNAEVGDLLRRFAPEEGLKIFRSSATHAALLAAAPDNIASLESFFSRRPLDVTAELLTAISAEGPGIGEADLAALEVPTLVLGSAFDAIHPLEHARRLAALVPGARFREITPKGRDKAAYIADIHSAFEDILEELTHA